MVLSEEERGRLHATLTGRLRATAAMYDLQIGEEDICAMLLRAGDMIEAQSELIEAQGQLIEELEQLKGGNKNG